MVPFIIHTVGKSDDYAVEDASTARSFVLTALGDRDAVGGPEDELCGAVHDLSEQRGGAIGPLPDGSYIDVSPTTWVELARRGGISGSDLAVVSHEAFEGDPAARARILAAFNDERADDPPVIDWDKVRDVNDAILPVPFPSHDQDGCPGEGERLDHIAHGSRVVDSVGERYTLMGHGSVQGSVILRDRFGRMFHADGGQHLKRI